ncbi:hypothetical protein [Rhizobium sp. CSW-27]|uniref:hypothetical protein n=1 Tax=Rhizobium sp. CSW-27 TaxID=2839985 RepID=UPI001C019C0C|nr:hypothetical protein [Rhizobium sp. CSW-27]MBT9371280.1 hypothetical protein [Rhizobium sp. CSW-27]
MSLLIAGGPAMWRGDLGRGLAISMTALVAGLCLVVAGMGLWGLPLGWLATGAMWGSLYNRLYTTRLLARGYRLAGTEEENGRAALALGIEGTGAATCLG